MKVTEIVVSAGRTFNHPHEQFSNLRPEVTLKASLDEGDNPDECVKALQARAEQIIEDHKTHMLASLKQLYRLRLIERERASLEESIRTSQRRLEHLRERAAGDPPAVQDTGEFLPAMPIKPPEYAPL